MRAPSSVGLAGQPVGHISVQSCVRRRVSENAYARRHALSVERGVEGGSAESELAPGPEARGLRGSWGTGALPPGRPRRFPFVPFSPWCVRVRGVHLPSISPVCMGVLQTKAYAPDQLAEEVEEFVEERRQRSAIGLPLQ